MLVEVQHVGEASHPASWWQRGGRNSIGIKRQWRQHCVGFERSAQSQTGRGQSCLQDDG